MASIRTDHLCKRYGSVSAVDDLCLTCNEGELLALLGPSGCGKTSTLKMIAGIESVSAGEIYFDGRPVSHLRPAERNIAMVFEDYALYPHLSVSDNIAFPLEVRRQPAPRIRRAVGGMIELLGLEDVKDETVRNLSGGAQQRVAIGRALVRKPELVLFDEPLSHLDGDQKVRLRGEIKRLQKETNFTAVLVTHDQTEAMAMADRVAVMNLGVLQQLDTPEALYRRPASLFVGNFIGDPPMNLLEGRLAAEGGALYVEFGAARGGARLPVERATAAGLRGRGAGEEVVVGVRPEHLELIPADAGGGFLRGRVFFREPRGDTEVVLVTLEGAPREPGAAVPDAEILAVEVAEQLSMAVDDPVAVRVTGSRLHFFDGRSGANLETTLVAGEGAGWAASS